MKIKLKNYDPIEGEIADIFIILTSICNTLNINLYETFMKKKN